MPGVACVGVDIAGGTQLGMQAAKFRVHGNPVVVIGDHVAGHGIPPHDAPVMAEGTAKFRVGGIPVCRAGHHASCGHATSGRPFFRIP
jgi:uncharacterized Zn-binding protein involved in type VI secretion